MNDTGKIINLTGSANLDRFNLPHLCYGIEQKTDDYYIGLLPDAHTKPQLESPSSAVYAVKDFYSFHLTSPSPNCGISLLKTAYSETDLNSDNFLTSFYKKFKENVPLYPDEKRLNSDQVLDVLAHGAQALIRILDMDPDLGRSIEMHGNVFTEDTISSEYVAQIIPKFIQDMSRFRFGILGGGNHFLEFQVVDEVYDSALAKLLAIQLDQAMIMFHTGSEAVGSLIGRIYALREKTSRKMNLKLFPEKLKFHLQTLELSNLRQKLDYFLPNQYIFNVESNPEGQRALKAYHAAFNFGYANRLYITHQIQNLFKHFFKADKMVDLFFDISHNSIFKERYKDNSYYFHRHNSCRIQPKEYYNDHPAFSKTGQPILIPGTNRHSSFLCVAGDQFERSLNTIDHGFGKLLMGQVNNTAENVNLGSSKLFYYQKDAYEPIRLQVDSVNISELKRLEKMGILKPVARLRPFATLKGPKAKYT